MGVTCTMVLVDFRIRVKNIILYAKQFENKEEELCIQAQCFVFPAFLWH